MDPMSEPPSSPDALKRHKRRSSLFFFNSIHLPRKLVKPKPGKPPEPESILHGAQDKLIEQEMYPRSPSVDELEVDDKVQTLPKSPTKDIPPPLTITTNTALGAGSTSVISNTDSTNRSTAVRNTSNSHLHIFGLGIGIAPLGSPRQEALSSPTSEVSRSQKRASGRESDPQAHVHTYRRPPDYDSGSVISATSSRFKPKGITRSFVETGLRVSAEPTAPLSSSGSKAAKTPSMAAVATAAGESKLSMPVTKKVKIMPEGEGKEKSTRTAPGADVRKYPSTEIGAGSRIPRVSVGGASAPSVRGSGLIDTSVGARVNSASSSEMGTPVRPRVISGSVLGSTAHVPSGSSTMGNPPRPRVASGNVVGSRTSSTLTARVSGSSIGGPTPLPTKPSPSARVSSTSSVRVRVTSGSIVGGASPVGSSSRLESPTRAISELGVGARVRVSSSGSMSTIGVGTAPSRVGFPSNPQPSSHVGVGPAKLRKTPSSSTFTSTRDRKDSLERHRPGEPELHRMASVAEVEEVPLTSSIKVQYSPPKKSVPTLGGIRITAKVTDPEQSRASSSTATASRMGMAHVTTVLPSVTDTVPSPATMTAVASSSHRVTGLGGIHSSKIGGAKSSLGIATRDRKHGSFDFERPGWGWSAEPKSTLGVSSKRREASTVGVAIGVTPTSKIAGGKVAGTEAAVAAQRNFSISALRTNARPVEVVKNSQALEKGASVSRNPTGRSIAKSASKPNMGPPPPPNPNPPTASSWGRNTGKRLSTGLARLANGLKVGGSGNGGSSGTKDRQHGKFAFEPPVPLSSRRGSVGSTTSNKSREKERPTRVPTPSPPLPPLPIGPSISQQSKSTSKNSASARSASSGSHHSHATNPHDPSHSTSSSVLTSHTHASTSRGSTPSFGYRSGTKGRSLDLGLGLAWAPTCVREDAIIPESSLGRSLSASRREQEKRDRQRQERQGKEMADAIRSVLDEAAYRNFKKDVHRFDAHEIPFDGPTGIVARVERLLESAPNLTGDERRTVLDGFVKIILQNAG